MSTGQHIGNPSDPDRPPHDPGYHIRHIRREDIDTTRWDACIAGAANSLIYGFHFYLDHITAGQWDALILGNYEAVMPLPWRRKFGIRYCYQPPFTQQTGIFSAQSMTTGLIEAFLQTTRDHFRFAELFLNYGNAHPSLRPRTNYILALDAPYGDIAKQYKKILVYSLKLAARASLRYTTAIDLETALIANHREYAARTPHVTQKDHTHFRALCNDLQTRGQLVLRAATTPNGQIMASALLFRDRRRLYLLQSTTPKEGRRVEANRFLLDGIIREFATQPLLLDFEGSEIPGVAHFYANFGGTRQNYFFYRHNHLPWPLKR